MYDLDSMRHSRFEGLGKRDNFGKRFIFVRCRDDYIFTESVLPDTRPIESVFPLLRIYARSAEKFNSSCEQVT
jgi:hypothetical protein